MVKETLKRIFKFLEEKENKLVKEKGTLMWKLAFNEPLTKEDLNIKGGLFLQHSHISYLPKGLKVSDNLSLAYTPKLKSLPSDLDVKGNICLEGSNIASLPEGLKVGGDLDLAYTKITSLPKGLEVGGDLYIENTELEGYIDEEIREMIKPGFIKRKNSKIMEKEALKRIFEFLEEKENHKVPFIIKVKCEIPFTKEQLNVKHSLYLRYSRIKSLPEGLKVGGGLDLQNSSIESLPEDLKVGGDLYLNNSQINSLPEGLKISGDLDLSYTYIRSLPKGMKVGGHLDLTETDIEFLPKGLEVGGVMFIEYTPLKKYTDDELREMVKPGFIKGKIHR